MNFNLNDGFSIQLSVLFSNLQSMNFNNLNPVKQSHIFAPSQ